MTFDPSKISPEEFAKSVREFEKFTRLLTQISPILLNLVKGTGEGLDGIKGKLKDIGTAGEEAFDEIEEASADTVDLVADSWHNVAAVIRASLEEVRAEFDKIERHPGVALIMGSPDSKGLISGGGGGISRMAGDFRDKALGGTAFGAYGAVAGLALTDVQQQSEYITAANRALAQFARTSLDTQKNVGALRQEFQDLKPQMDDAPQKLEAAFAGLVAGGVKAQDAFKVVAPEVKGFGRDVKDAAVVVDSLFQLQPGVGGQVIGQLVKETGASVETATRQALAMGQAVAGTGVDVQAFLSTMQQATSSLRLHGQTVDDLLKSYEGMKSTLRGVFPGRGEEFIGDIAMKGLGGLAAGVGGMPEGAQAFLAQKMFPGQNPLESLFKFRTEEKSGNGEGFIKGLVGTLGNEFGGMDKFAFGRLLEKNFGFSFETATVLSQARGALVGGAAPDDVMKKYGDSIQTAMQRESNKQDPIQAIISAIQNVLGGFGRFVMEGIAALVRIGISTVAVLSRNPNANEYFQASMESTKKGFGDAIGNIMKQTETLKHANMQGVEKILPNMNLEMLDRPAKPRSTGEVVSSEAASQVALGATGPLAIPLSVGYQLLFRPEIVKTGTVSEQPGH